MGHRLRLIRPRVADVRESDPVLYQRPAVPSGMTEDRYIKWIQVLPGAVKIDHHIIVLAHQPESPIAPLIEDRNRGDRGNNNTNNGGGAAGNAAGAGVGPVGVGGEKGARVARNPP